MTVYRLINESVKANAISDIEQRYGGTHEVVIRKVTRSLPQNSYWHKLVDIVAKFTGDDPEDFKLRLKYEFLPLQPIQVKGVTYLYPPSTASLNKEQFSLLIEKTLMLGNQLGLTMPLPSFYGLQEQ